MRRTYLILSLLLLCGMSVRSQEVKTVKGDTLGLSSVLEVETATRAEMPSVAVCPDESVLDIHKVFDERRSDTLGLPTLNRYGQMPLSLYPAGWGGFYDWQLHEGLNISLGASVFSSFGKRANGGAGFAQNISAMYAVPLSKNMSFAIGGYFNNMYWGGRSYRDGGLNAVFGYRFDNHWEAYLYGQKSVVNRRMPLPLYDINGLGDRIGAAVKYNFSPTFSVTVSVEERRR